MFHLDVDVGSRKTSRTARYNQQIEHRRFCDLVGQQYGRCTDSWGFELQEKYQGASECIIGICAFEQVCSPVI